MRKPLRPHREGPTIVGGVSEVILTVLYDKRKRVTFWVTPFILLFEFQDIYLFFRIVIKLTLCKITEFMDNIKSRLMKI